jgi:HlyD family secretion protein
MSSVPKIENDNDPSIWQVRRRLAIGLGLVALLVGSVGGWAATAKLSGSVIAQGLIVVDSNVKKVQHPTGGVVGAILVKNGDRISVGDVVMRLDDTQTRANLGIVVSQLVQLIGRKARLEAERDDAEVVVFPAGFEESDPEAPAIASGERRLFEARRIAKNGQKSQLRERIGQYKVEIEGLVVQRAAKETELQLMREELARVSEMVRRFLLPTTRQLSAQRDLARLEGEAGMVISQAARSAGQISEIELQIIGLDQTQQSDAIKDLREIEARIAELSERRVAAMDQLQRIDLRAPQSGLVHDLAVHTVGGVIGASELVMTIVPDDDVLAIEARVANNDIDQITIGQRAMLRFVAFNQRTTPEINGTVTRIGADISKDQQSGNVYYVVRILPLDEDLEKVRKLHLVPGMPVEAYVQTGERTALSYLTKPFADQISRAFREE